MRRTLAAKAAAATVALATVSVGGAYAAHDLAPDEADATAVVNKNGHEVNENAAHGQARAALARAQNDELADEPTEEPVEEPVEEPAEQDSGDPADEAPTDDAPEVPAEEPAEEPAGAQGPNAAAGDHPDERAYLKGANGNHHGQTREPSESGASGEAKAQAEARKAERGQSAPAGAQR